MAKKSAVERNKKRERMINKYSEIRKKLKNQTKDLTKSLEERFSAQIKLASLPRNSSRVRFKNRCKISGHPKSVYRKFGLSRIVLRNLASEGLIPGFSKASW